MKVTAGFDGFQDLSKEGARGRIVLFGGFDSYRDRPLGDTWEWDGTTWLEKTGATSPSARRHHAMAYDSARRRVVFFGGYDLDGPRGDTWEWDGSVGTELTPVTSPRARWGHTMAYDGARLVLFGGYEGLGFRGDTWEYPGEECGLDAAPCDDSNAFPE